MAEQELEFRKRLLQLEKSAVLIRNVITNIKKKGKDNITLEMLEDRLTRMKEEWERFRNLDLEVELLATEEERKADYFERKCYDQIRVVYEEQRDEVIGFIKQKKMEDQQGRNETLGSQDDVSRRSENSTSNVKYNLPRIQLPMFSGDYCEWTNFRRLFESLVVNNTDLHDAARFHYLRNNTSGDALSFVKTLDSIEDNFTSAWKEFKQQYEHPRFIVQALLKRFFDIRVIVKDTLTGLKNLGLVTQEVITAMKGLERDVKSDFFVYRVITRFDSVTREEWENSLGDETEFPDFERVMKFIRKRVSTLEALKTAMQTNDNKSNRTKIQNHVAKVGENVNNSGAKIVCSFCRGSHKIYACNNFRAIGVKERDEFVRKNQLCLNCLCKGHGIKDCRSSAVCASCRRKHHTLLHFDRQSVNNDKANRTNATNESNNNAASQNNEDNESVNIAATAPQIHAMLSSRDKRSFTLLATVRLKIRTAQGRTMTARALLDQGSQASFVSENIVQVLRIKTQTAEVMVSGLEGTQSKNIKSRVEITVEPVVILGQGIRVSALVLPKLTSYVPRKLICIEQYVHLRDLELADPFRENEKNTIDLILGADVYGSLLREGLRKGSDDSPTAQLTIFGWILSGPMQSSSVSLNVSAMHVHAEEEELMSGQLKRFWEVEELPEGSFEESEKESRLSEEEKECERYFVKTVERDKEGKYRVRLPFRKPPPLDLGNSESIARAALYRLERRFAKNIDLEKEYKKFMIESIEKGYIKPFVATRESPKPLVFIPHLAVVRADSQTTKLRVVFNASASTSNGRSLNDCLMPGEKLQSDLVALIINWRTFKFVFSTDIEKMFNQVKLQECDRKFQCILWRDAVEKEPETYYLDTLAFGEISSPYLAQRVIIKLAEDEGGKFPLGKQILLNYMYVDDILFGANEVEEALKKMQEVISILNAGGFKARKWASNEAEFLKKVDTSDHGLAINYTDESRDGFKILGIYWVPKTDAFKIKVRNETARLSSTKREIMSIIAKFFDPLGWISPVIIAAKILLQSLWLIKVGWDDPLPGEILKQWQDINATLRDLENIRIPRATIIGSHLDRVELHGFSDASMHAYAAVVYLRTISRDKQIKVHLVLSKTKVAPIQTLSIPRLELCGAYILAKTIEYVRKVLKLDDIGVYCWSDSQVVLSWLRKPPNTWKTFVANRVAKIQKLSGKADWRYVNTKCNPADCASRGLTPNELVNSVQWWEGPEWLQVDESDWPTHEAPVSSNTELEASKTVSVNVAVELKFAELIEKISRWSKLIRVTAYIKRFITNAKQRSRVGERKINKNSEVFLTGGEVRTAIDFWVKNIQERYFSIEIKRLKADLPIGKNSVLSKLNCFLDEGQIIRVGGRLSRSGYSYGTKHPVVLPKARISEILVEHYHKCVVLHGGVQLTLRVVREKYWILGARNLVKAVINNCVVCTRARGKTLTQIMADLPKARIQISRPFAHTGVDYAGPFNVRSFAGRGQKSHKAYVSLFICLSTRAIHLELVFDCTTKAFLAAFERFAARRALPTDMYSDNGTNFQGAEKELRVNFRAITKETGFRSFFADHEINWHFSPPIAPHHGGLWEAGVKSTKHHLRRSLGNLTPTGEELTTLLCKIEMCLNSRPIAPLYDDPDTFDALTPGHFLVGTSLKTMLTPSVLEIADNRLSRWESMQKIFESFGRLWQAEYLHTLQQRQKWTEKTANLKQGDMILLKNDNLPPAKWELGRVTDCLSDSKGVVRQVKVKTALSSYIRAITQLVRLPIPAAKLCTIEN